jgi:hypothetical protein
MMQGVARGCRAEPSVSSASHEVDVAELYRVVRPAIMLREAASCACSRGRPCRNGDGGSSTVVYCHAAAGSARACHTCGARWSRSAPNARTQVVPPAICPPSISQVASSSDWCVEPVRAEWVHLDGRGLRRAMGG